MEKVTKRATKAEVMQMMDPLIAEWFESKFDDLTEPQSYAVPVIHERKNILVSSPTGSGKTLTAFLSIINELFKRSKEGKLEDRIYAVYISPLKALANDINKNLEEPLREMHELAKVKGYDWPKVRVGVRSGDTSQAERQRQLRSPPHIFITTPESLAMVLAAPKFREKFSQVEYLIIDEIHEICDAKRGAHLSLTLERLQELSQRPITRIGLSATLAPIESIASFLVGYENGEMRDVKVLEVKTKRNLDLKVICPTDDITTLPYEIVNSKMYDQLKEMIEQHRTTLVFTNTRTGTESVVYKLKERGIESIEAHHGSLSKETRLDVEERLKTGQLRCVVSSTSLELGIDIGSVDLVVQIGSPKSVAKGLQRIGRSGHSHVKTPKGRMMVFDLDDLVECAVLCRAAHQRNIDRVTIPENCLDVLAQSIVGMSIEKRWDVDEAFDLVRRSHCFRRLERETFLQVLRYLGSKDSYEGVYSKIWFDEEAGVFGRKKGARMIYFLNLGTIPEEANYKVFTEKGAMVGDLSEKFVERLATRDVFVLGGKSYEFIRAKGMKAFVRNAQGRKPTVPTWTGEMLPRSFDLSMEVAKFRGEMASRLDRDEKENIEWLIKDFDIDEGSARSIISYVKEQRDTAKVPDDRTFIIEGYLDNSGNSNVIFHFPFGRRVNDALSRAYAFQVTARLGCNVSVSVVDDAFMLTIPRKVDLSMFDGLVRSADLEDILRRAVKDSELFKQRFRHTAARSFMILRNYKGREVSVNRQQVRSTFLLDRLGEAKDAPVIEETYREVLEDVMDIQNAAFVLKQLETGKARLDHIEFSQTPSPFAHNVVLAGISDIVLMEDRSSLLRELHRRVLSKVLGVDVRAFEFDADKVNAYFRGKIGRVDSKEALLDLLRRAGPMHIFKEKGRNVYPYSNVPREKVDAWASELLREGKISSIVIDDVQFIATEQLPEYASALSKEKRPDELEMRLLQALTEERTVQELEQLAGVENAKVLRALRNLETSFLVRRSSFMDGKYRFSVQAPIERRDRQASLDKVMARLLGISGPLTVEEAAFTLGISEDEAKQSLTALVEEGIATEGRFVVSEHMQYMLKIDHLRLSSEGREVYDSRTVASYRRTKLNGPFTSIEDCVRFLGNVGMLIDVDRRVPGFRLDDWVRLRKEGKLLLGRFFRGRVRYILEEDAADHVAAFRQGTLGFLDEQILELLRQNDGLSMRQVVAMTGLPKEEVKESIDRLDRGMYIVRRYEDGEDWSRENFYIPYVPGKASEDPKRRIVERFVRAYGPIPVFTIKMVTDFSYDEVEKMVASLPLTRVYVGDQRTEMVLFEDEKEALDGHVPKDEGMTIVSLYDPEVQPMWAEISSRFGDGWIFPILHNGRLVGATEKWEMSGCVELRSLDLDDPSLLPQALDAVDRLMEFYRGLGFDVVRIKEVLDRPVSDLDEEVRGILEEHGFIRLEGMYVKGRVLPVQYDDQRLMAYVLRKQRIDPEDHFHDPLAGIRFTGGFRSDVHAWQRCNERWPLKKLYEQGTLVKVFGVPDYVTYTTMEHAKLFRKAKGAPLDEKDVRTVLRVLEREGPISRRTLYDLSPLGQRTTYEALKKLFDSTAVYQDRSGKIRVVPDIDMSVDEARKRVVKLMFRNYGTFTAEELARFMRIGMGMRQIREVLAELEDEGFLSKGFLLSGDDSLHWMLAEDVDMLARASFEHRFVLAPDDSLMLYLMPRIKARFGLTMPFHVIFDGTEMVAIVRTNSRGKEIAITEFIGPREARRIMNEHIRRMGLTLRESLDERERDWEIQEFYERTHFGDFTG
ncbi:MAG: ATP-dependent helicase [Methanomassiliicoccales archaeon]|nr:MAG: ATP-dependent helicase [Methanomassiliicoccales archaeon]